MNRRGESFGDPAHMDATERSDTLSREAGVFEADAGFASPFGRIFLLHKSLLSAEITVSEVTG